MNEYILPRRPGLFRYSRRDAIPVVFAFDYGKGRVFNSGFGHPDETWDDPRVQKMYFEAIKWVLGMTEGSTGTHPRAQTSEDQR